MKPLLRFPAFASILLLASLARAGDAIVTLQYENPKATAAAGTSVLEPRTLEAVYGAFPGVKGRVVNQFDGQIGKLSSDELKKNFADAKAAISQLGIGALLVLNCHSSSEKIGVPNEKGETELIPWEGFWTHFGIARPPRLALVVLNGCVGVHHTDGSVGSPTDEDLERVRCAMHTEAMMSGKRNIATADSQAEIVNFFTKLKGEEARAGAGWEVQLDGDDGPLAPLRILAMRKARFFDAKTLTINSLKQSAVDFGRPCKVATAGATDTISPSHDDAHTSEIALGDAAVKWDASDLTTNEAKVPFRFEFRPRKEIVRAVLEIRVRVVGTDARGSRWTFVAPVEHAALHTDFSKFEKGDGDLVLKFPSDETLAANPRARLADTHRALYDRLMAGRLRCVVGSSLRVLSGQLVVTYAD